jgi:hypothetical protein
MREKDLSVNQGQGAQITKVGFPSSSGAIAPIKPDIAVDQSRKTLD